MDSDGSFIKKIGFQDVVNKAVENAGLNLIVKVTQGNPDSKVKVEQQYEDGKNLITFTIPRGEKGEKGDTWQPYIAEDGNWHVRLIQGGKD